MKGKKVLCAVLAASLLTGPLAFAQGDSRGPIAERNDQSQRSNERDRRGHHLSAPPRGYHWVQSGSDYILVAIATGVILNLLLNNN